jgi:DNA-binding CsgD family transcriptional regulator
VTPGDAAKASGQLLELLDRTDNLMNEVQTVLRRIGVELERLGISPSTLPPSSRPRACPELDSLSPRESEVVKLLMEGHRVSTIARALFISPHTVRNHLQAAYRKSGVKSQVELIEMLKGAASPSPAPTESAYFG